MLMEMNTICLRLLALLAQDYKGIIKLPLSTYFCMQHNSEIFGFYRYRSMKSWFLMINGGYIYIYIYIYIYSHLFK
jgi:hypothetical protein